MEEWTRQVVTSLNSAENHRALVLDVVNLDLPEKEHYVQDFEITFSTVVLAEFQEGKPLRWKNLANVWDFSQDETTFKKYLEGEMGAFMEDGR